MGRAYSISQDDTNVFRQKVTRKGMSVPNRWVQDPEPPKPYETVVFYGPYRTRNVGGDPWLNAGDTEIKVELQKLEAVPPGVLEWVTEKERVTKREEG